MPQPNCSPSPAAESAPEGPVVSPIAAETPAPTLPSDSITAHSAAGASDEPGSADDLDDAATDEGLTAAASGLARVSQLPDAPTERELQTGESPRRFAALRHRNFRLFWIGNVVSNIGSLAQQTAQGWLVRDLTTDPLTITIVAACASAPFLFVTLYAGVMADRVDKRRALIITNASAAVMALLLAGLVWGQVVQIWHVALISFAAGVIAAFDIPIRQSFNLEMVGHDDLPNAIALNSTAFNVARVAGPAAGGFLLREVGVDGCFLINALSFAAIIVGLAMMVLPPHTPVTRKASFKSFWRGVVYVRRHPTLWLVTMLVGVVSLLSMPFGTLLPVFARDIFHSDETGFAGLMVCNGIGALGSALSLAAAGKMQHRGKRLLLGAFLFCLGVVAFASSPNIMVAGFCLIVSGWFLLTFLMTANTMVQTLSPDNLRGRIFSIYMLALIGTAPIGAVLLGAVARYFSDSRFAVQLLSMLAAMFTFWVYMRFRELWKER